MLIEVDKKFVLTGEMEQRSIGFIKKKILTSCEHFKSGTPFFGID